MIHLILFLLELPALATGTFWIGMSIALVFLAIRRIGIKKKEKFEKRDN